MSVTRIEAWLKNPYEIFARDILKLEKLPMLGKDPDAALRGSVVHEIMSGFAQRYPDTLPADAHAELMGIARLILADYDSHARVAAFWLPRFERFAEWFADTEAARRDGVTRVFAEIGGNLVIPAPAGPFTLSARADRIDHRGGGLVITDYKTGSAPKASHVASGVRPQLPLEAAIAFGQAGFTGVPHLPVTELRYISATGSEPPGDQLSVGQRRHRHPGRHRSRPAGAAHRPLRRPGDALQGAAARALRLSLRRIRAPGPRRRMVGARRGRGGLV